MVSWVCSRRDSYGITLTTFSIKERVIGIIERVNDKPLKNDTINVKVIIFWICITNRSFCTTILLIISLRRGKIEVHSIWTVIWANIRKVNLELSYVRLASISHLFRFRDIFIRYTFICEISPKIRLGEISTYLLSYYAT